MNELVKYNDDMNKLKFTGFTPTHMDFLMAICAKAKSQGINEITLDIQELIDISGYKKGGGRNFYKELDAMIDQLQKINGKIVDRSSGSEVFVKFVLFPTFEYSIEKGWLKVKVNERFAHLLNEFEKYTSFELAEFVELKSKYSKNLYRFLKKWRGQGYYDFHSIAEFREVLDCPEKYTNRQMMQDCVSVAIEEITKLDKSFKDFKCIPEYARKRGKPLEKMHFTWQPERKKFVDWNADQVEGQISFADTKEFDKLTENCKTKPKNKFKNCKERQRSDRLNILEEKVLLGTKLTPEEREEYEREKQKANESVQ